MRANRDHSYPNSGQLLPLRLYLFTQTWPVFVTKYGTLTWWFEKIWILLLSHSEVWEKASIRWNLGAAAPDFLKAMAPHSSTLAWKIPWTEEPGRLQSMGLRRVGHDWSDLAAAAAPDSLRPLSPALQILSRPDMCCRELEHGGRLQRGKYFHLLCLCPKHSHKDGSLMGASTHSKTLVSPPWLWPALGDNFTDLSSSVSNILLIFCLWTHLSF